MLQMFIHKGTEPKAYKYGSVLYTDNGSNFGGFVSDGRKILL